MISCLETLLTSCTSSTKQTLIADEYLMIDLILQKITRSSCNDGKRGKLLVTALQIDSTYLKSVEVTEFVPQLTALRKLDFCSLQ